MLWLTETFVRGWSGRSGPTEKALTPDRTAATSGSLIAAKKLPNPLLGGEGGGRSTSGFASNAGTPGPPVLGLALILNAVHDRPTLPAVPPAVAMTELLVTSTLSKGA